MLSLPSDIIQIYRAFKEKAFVELSRMFIKYRVKDL